MLPVHHPFETGFATRHTVACDRQQLPIQSKQFDRLFAMPQRVNPLALAAAHGIDGRQVACLEDLPEALEWGLAQGRPALLRLATDREADARLRTQLRSAAQNAEPLL